MKRRFNKAAPLLLLTLTSGNAAELDPQTIDNAKTFLAAYVKTINTGSSELPTLYSDTALINFTITTKDKRTQTREISGQDWKRILRDKMTGDKATPEPVELHNVRIQGKGQNLEIAAQRYSINRCYWDMNYSMVITPDGRNDYQINRETLFINHNNQCQPPETLIIKQAIKINQNPVP